MKTKSKTILFISMVCVIVLSLIVVAYTTGNTKIGKAYESGEFPAAFKSVRAKKDPFLEGLKVEMKELPGHDDVIFTGDGRVGYASGMDGWIWKLDFKKGRAQKWAKPPLSPSGMRFSNKKKNTILFCAARLGGENYGEKERVGLYEISVATKKIRPLILDLPRTNPEEFSKVYKLRERPSLKIKDLNPSNSRPFSLCKDLAVSQDGNRIYISEPFERKDAAMGSGAMLEAIGLYPHGKLWLYDRKEETISLVLSGFTFVDGILLEETPEGDESVIFTETTKFRIIRAFLSWKKQGGYEVLFDNLPGLADGLDRDEQGRIWIGIIKKRSPIINFIHRNPWLKPLFLAIPRSLLPVSKHTGFMVLDSTGNKLRYFVIHDGSRVSDISVSVPFADRVYFPSFDKSSRGLYSLSIAELGL